MLQLRKKSIPQVARSFAAPLLTLVSISVLATSPLPATLEDLAKNCDHILAGHVVGVDMIDQDGKQIVDEKTGTGPGLKSTIRLIIKVDEVYFSRAKQVPDIIRVPLDSNMHFSLGQIKAAHQGASAKMLLILQGTYEPVVPGHLLRDMSEVSEAMAIREKAQRGLKRHLKN